MKHFQRFKLLQQKTQWSLLSHAAAFQHLLSLPNVCSPSLSPFLFKHVASSGQYGGFMVRVHQFDPWSRGRCVNSSITGDTSPAQCPAVSRAAHLSLFAAPGSSQKHRVSSRVGPLQGAKGADPPRTHPSFMDCNPRPVWVTGAKRGSQGGRTMELDVCIHVCVSFSFGVRWCGALCQLVPDSQTHSVPL